MARGQSLYRFEDCEVVTMSGRTQRLDAGVWRVHEDQVVVVYIGDGEVRLPPAAFTGLVDRGIASRRGDGAA